MTEPETTAEPIRVMVIGAHPDDPEFGCAGTVAKWAGEGKELTYLLLTSGDKGSHNREMSPGAVASIREKEQEAAARELGVRAVIFQHHPDGVLVNNLDLRREVCEIIRRHRPNVVMTIDPWRLYQLHPDHRAAGQAALDAVYAAREHSIFPEQLVGEVEPWRVDEIFLFWTDNADYWEDVTASMDRRIAALKRHQSQLGERVDQVEERIRKMAKTVGEKPGFEYAEGFKRIILH
jgi:LmbE family N-acetylglucosaminyl deacetylase